MQKQQKSLRNFFSSLVLGASLLFIGCGVDKETDEAKKFEVSRSIDSGDFEKAIILLKDGCAGYSDRDCNLNLGAALYGQAGVDIIGLVQELTKINNNIDEKKKTADAAGKTALDQLKTTKLAGFILTTFGDPALSEGQFYFSKTLVDSDKNITEACEVLMEADFNSTISSELAANSCLQDCTKDYDNLDALQKQACLASTPTLLASKAGVQNDDSSGSGDSSSSDLGVELSPETINKVTTVLTAASPELPPELATAALTLTPEQIKTNAKYDPEIQRNDLNSNGSFDSNEMTECTINGFNAGADIDNPNLTKCVDKNISMVTTSSQPFKQAATSNLVLVQLEVTPSIDVDALKEALIADGLDDTVKTTYFRYAQAYAPGVYTTAKTDKYCEDTMKYCDDLNVSNGCFPCPVLDIKRNEDGTPVTALDDSNPAKAENINEDITDILNTGDTLSNLAGLKVKDDAELDGDVQSTLDAKNAAIENNTSLTEEQKTEQKEAAATEAKTEQITNDICWKSGIDEAEKTEENKTDSTKWLCGTKDDGSVEITQDAFNNFTTAGGTN
jgi:hypothetical protein